MQALVIVIPHVALEREAQLALRREPRAVDQLCLQRMKERLHMRVVARGRPARGALPDAQDPEAIAERPGGILAAAITVEDEAGARAPPAHPPLGAQRALQPGTPVRPVMLREQAVNVRAQLPVLSGVGTARACPPRVVARAGDPVERAEPRHGVLPPLRVDERERVPFCVAQNRMAFFRRACSSCSSAWARSSAWSRRISRAGGTFPPGARGPRSTPSRAAFRHRDSITG